MTAFIPTTIDLAPPGSYAQDGVALVGGLTPWTTEDGDTSYIQLASYQLPIGGGSDSSVRLLIPPGLPLSWFYDPVYDIDVRTAGTLTGHTLLVSLDTDGHSGPAGPIFFDFFLPPAAYGVQRRINSGALPGADISAFWAYYSSGGAAYMALNYAQAGVFGAPDPAQASARITYFACWVEDPDVTEHIPLRGRQRAAGVFGSIPLRGRNNAPYGLRGRQESNR